MEFNAQALVLLRQNFREADRMVSIYSKDHGRINVRFSGVNKACGKLKALSEPLVHGHFRVYVRRGASIGCVTGGKLECVFPNIRKDIKKIKTSLHFCELMFRLTPEHQPNENKFNLLLESLNSLEHHPVAEGASAAFILRLMSHAGFGMEKPALGISEEFWHKMHSAPLHELNFNTPLELVFLNKTNYICRRFLNKYLTYPLNTLKEEPFVPAFVEEQEETFAPREAAFV